MRDRIQLGRVLNALDQIVRQLARRTARAVSHADEMRHVILQLADRLVKTLGGFRRFRRKELERKRRANLRA